MTSPGASRANSGTRKDLSIAVCFDNIKTTAATPNSQRKASVESATEHSVERAPPQLLLGILWMNLSTSDLNKPEFMKDDEVDLREIGGVVKGALLIIFCCCFRVLLMGLRAELTWQSEGLRFTADALPPCINAMLIIMSKWECLVFLRKQLISNDLRN